MSDSRRDAGSGRGDGSAPERVLVIDDESSVLRALRRILSFDGFSAELAEGPEQAEAWLRDPDLAVVLLDLFIGDRSGLDVLAEIRRARPDVEVIVMTGRGSIDSAVACMRRGASDYLCKPFDDMQRLRRAVTDAIGRRRAARPRTPTVPTQSSAGDAPELVGQSPVMRSLKRTLACLAGVDSPVLIRGESGAGKERAARAIHDASDRARAGFEVIHCATLAEADGERVLTAVSPGGTLLLDEVADLAPAVQPLLLRLLRDSGSGPEPGGARAPRILATSEADLEGRMAEGRFRRDLFYRLDVVRVDVPPLRERREDIPALVHHFLAKHQPGPERITAVSPEALEDLERQAWPGNVRELENAVIAAVALGRGPVLQQSDLPAASTPAPGRGPDPEIPLSLEAYERSALERALAEAEGDASAAARRLGIGRSTFYRKLGKHGIRPRRAEDRPRGGSLPGVSSPRPIG